jgi:hypothetical protein
MFFFISTGIAIFIILIVLIWHTMMVAEELGSIYELLHMINSNFKKFSIENSKFQRELLNFLENKSN